MLTPEQANEQLKRHEDRNAREELSRRLGALEPELSAIGLAFLDGVTARYIVADQDAKRKRVKAQLGLEQQDERSRRTLFAALFPPVHEYVEASWQLQMRLPYQTGYLRRAFRAPNDPAYTARARVEWVQSLLRAVLPFRYDLEFLISWAARIGWGAEHSVGLLLSGVLDSGGAVAEQALTKLVSIVNGEHETAQIGRYVITALLSCSNPDAWAVVERLLLAAQRQEGVRQVVMESIDFANAEAYRRMLGLMVDERLSRFAAVARGVAVWFGMSVDSVETAAIDTLLRETLENLTQPALRAKRLTSAAGQTLYLALWAGAFIDVVEATEDAGQIAHESDFERRYAAVHLLAQLRTTKSANMMVQHLFDADLRVALTAASALPTASTPSSGPDLFATVFSALQQLAARMPEDKLLEPALWDWNRIRARRSDIAAKLILYRGERSFADLAPHVPHMAAEGRAALLRSLQNEAKKAGELKTSGRDLTFSLLSDASNTVRELAFKLLQHAQISTQEAEAIEPLLARKASDLRRGVLRLLLNQSAAGCRASIERLANSGDKLMRQAADELRSEIEPQNVPAASLEDGLGLFHPKLRTRPALLRSDLQMAPLSPATASVLKSLEALIDTQREATVTLTDSTGEAVSELLGNLRGFGRCEEPPLREVWDTWWLAQEHELGAAAELELVRAACYVLPWHKNAAAQLAPSGSDAPALRFNDLCRAILGHLLLRRITATGLSSMLDLLEANLNLLTASSSVPDNDRLRGWRILALAGLQKSIDRCFANKRAIWDRDLLSRYWKLLRFIEESIPRPEGWCPPLEMVLEAHRQGAASEADVYAQLLARKSRRDLALVTTRKKSVLLERYPELTPIAVKCRDRILEVELRRGDLPTPVSPLALRLRSIFGAELALTILRQLGEEPLSRGYLHDNESKSTVFSNLLRVSMPAGEDTLETFAIAVKRLGIPKKRLVDLAVYAPQWAEYVEHATGMSGLRDAALWLHAHTKDTQWAIEEQIRDLWFAELSERTLLSRQELLDGAVDIDWFRRMRGAIKDKDWAMMLDSAKYASGASGHKRAELFAAALTSEVTRAELSEKVISKRNQDSVRAIGLLPLPPKEADQRSEILIRYELLQQFLRGSKKFGAQRQATDKLAYTIGLVNLARTAGYADPQRLSWAMEAEASADLRSGPIEATDSGVRGVLSINALGEPEVVFERSGKPLKDVPASLRKSPALSALRSRKSQLVEQSSRMRQSLEETMIRGDRFAGRELHELEAHPLLKPMLSCLLFAGEDGSLAWAHELDQPSEKFRIAHPVDLLSSGEWGRYQQECLESARIQPFKQAFRELYLITDAERRQHHHSSRYEASRSIPNRRLPWQENVAGSSFRRRAFAERFITTMCQSGSRSWRVASRQWMWMV